jgi:hypothetical protein
MDVRLLRMHLVQISVFVRCSIFPMWFLCGLEDTLQHRILSQKALGFHWIIEIPL